MSQRSPAVASSKKKPKKENREAPIQKAILDWLDANNIYCWRQATGGQLAWNGEDAYMRGSVALGMPDILGILPGGLALMIEVKTPKWNPPKPPRDYDPHVPLGTGVSQSTMKAWQRYQLQAGRIDTCNALGGVGFFARSLDECIGELRRRFPRLRAV